MVDTFVYRGGDALAGWAFHGLQTLGLALSTIAWLGVPVAALSTWIAARAPVHPRRP